LERVSLFFPLGIFQIPFVFFASELVRYLRRKRFARMIEMPSHNLVIQPLEEGFCATIVVMID
jgi:hypothetical protein